MQTFQKLVSNLLNTTFIGNWRLEKYPQAQYLKKLLSVGQFDCVLDVGANEGQFRDFLRNEVGWKGLILSFEPIPKLTPVLNRNAESDNQWHVYPYALGSQKGHLVINLTRDTQFSSMLLPKREMKSLFNEQDTVVEEIRVPVEVLEEVLPNLMAEYGFTRPYLKLDTQGFDLEVLKGLGVNAKIIQGLQTELSMQPIYSNMPDYHAVINYLKGQGYIISGIFPNNPSHFPRMIECDGHFVSASMVKQLDLKSN